MTEQNSEQTSLFKPGDRVKRKHGEGPLGTVRDVRIEVARESIKQEERGVRGVAITVLWDNGTLSHFVPNGLSKI